MSRKKDRAQINDALMGDDAMSHLMIDLFGRGNYTYDAEADLWVAIDRDYAGKGRGFVVVERGGNWFKAVIPAEVLQ
jgi:hypothetical protein